MVNLSVEKKTGGFYLELYRNTRTANMRRGGRVGTWEEKKTPEGNKTISNNISYF
jgi:hypothetical protein